MNTATINMKLPRYLLQAAERPNRTEAFENLYNYSFNIPPSLQRFHLTCFLRVTTLRKLRSLIVPGTNTIVYNGLEYTLYTPEAADIRAMSDPCFPSHSRVGISFRTHPTLPARAILKLWKGSTV